MKIFTSAASPASFLFYPLVWSGKMHRVKLLTGHISASASASPRLSVSSCSSVDAVVINDDDVCILAALRTPMGGFQGSLASFTGPALGAIAIKEVVAKSGILDAHINICSRYRGRINCIRSDASLFYLLSFKLNEKRASRFTSNWKMKGRLYVYM